MGWTNPDKHYSNQIQKNPRFTVIYYIMCVNLKKSAVELVPTTVLHSFLYVSVSFINLLLEMKVQVADETITRVNNYPSFGSNIVAIIPPMVSVKAPHWTLSVRKQQSYPNVTTVFINLALVWLFCQDCFRSGTRGRGPNSEALSVDFTLCL